MDVPKGMDVPQLQHQSYGLTFPGPEKQMSAADCDRAIEVFTKCKEMATSFLPKTKNGSEQQSVVSRGISVLSAGSGNSQACMSPLAAPASVPKCHSPRSAYTDNSRQYTDNSVKIDKSRSTNVNIGNKTTTTTVNNNNITHNHIVQPQGTASNSKADEEKKKKEEGMSNLVRVVLVVVAAAGAGIFAFFLGKNDGKAVHLKELHSFFKNRGNVPMPDLPPREKEEHMANVKSVLDKSEKIVKKQLKNNRKWQIALTVMLAATALVVVGAVLNIFPLVAAGAILLFAGGIATIYFAAKKSEVQKNDKVTLKAIEEEASKLIEYMEAFKKRLQPQIVQPSLGDMPGHPPFTDERLQSSEHPPFRASPQNPAYIPAPSAPPLQPTPQPAKVVNPPPSYEQAMAQSSKEPMG